MAQPSQEKDMVEEMLEVIEGNVPLEGHKPIITATLVGKVMCRKTLNKGAVKTIISKA